MRTLPIPLLQLLLSNDGTALQQGHHDDQGQQSSTASHSSRDPGNCTITHFVPGAVFGTYLDDKASDQTKHKADKERQELLREGEYVLMSQ